MSYYERGFCNTRDDFMNGNTLNYRCYTRWAIKGSDDYDGLCIVKMKNNQNKDLYTCIGIRHGNPFYLVSPQNTINTNVSQWCNATVNGFKNSRLYHYSSTNTNNDSFSCNLPDYNNTPKNSNLVGWYNSNDERLTEPINKWVTTDLPIFEISNDDFEGLNKYIRTGDDSEAVNYSDLHFSRLMVEIWLDGKYPTMYCKPTMEDDGEYDGEIITINITSSPTLNPTLTLSGVLNYDSMTDYSYDQYQNAVPIVSTHYNVDIGWGTHHCNGGGFYISSSGNVVSTTDFSTVSIVVVFHEGSPSDTDSEYPDDDTNFKTNPTYNNYSGTNTLTKTYELDPILLKQFGNFMWSSTFKDNVLSLLQSPIENIVSLKAMPLQGMGGTSEHIKVGNVDSNLSAPVVKDADSLKTTVGTVKIPRVFNNFIDYTQFNITIYLPFIGFKELDAIAVMGKKLKLYYIWDCVLGNVMAELYLQGSNDNMLLYQCYQGSAGIDIAITSTNRGQIENGYVANGLSAITNLFSGNLAGATKDVFSGLTQEFHTASNGVGNPSLLGKMDMTARIIIKRPQKFEPKNYGHTKGYPCYQYKKIKMFGDNNVDSNKFIKCDNFICSVAYDDNDNEIVINALDSEKREIKELLESGVFV